jgi:hypothetical protein
MVTIDLQKAFDIVDHQIVCQTLRCMGVKDVKWFESYLTERKQHVNVNVNLNSYIYLCLSVFDPTANSCYMPMTAP